MERDDDNRTWFRLNPNLIGTHLPAKKQMAESKKSSYYLLALFSACLKRKN